MHWISIIAIIQLLKICSILLVVYSSACMSDQDYRSILHMKISFIYKVTSSISVAFQETLFNVKWKKNSFIQDQVKMCPVCVSLNRVYSQQKDVCTGSQHSNWLSLLCLPLPLVYPFLCCVERKAFYCPGPICRCLQHYCYFKRQTILVQNYCLPTNCTLTAKH